MVRMAKMKPDPTRFGGGGIAPNGHSISKGMHLPVVADTDIQWHLRASTYDKCRVCGSDDMGYLTQSKRCCMKCSRMFELSVSLEDWWQQEGSRLRVLNRAKLVAA